MKGDPMSGTQDIDSAASVNAEAVQDGQPGVDENLQNNEETEIEPKLSASQKMDRLLRGNSSGQMKKEIEKLRKEAAKYRYVSKSESQQKAEIQKKADEIQKELDALKEVNRNLKVMRALDNAGCIKSELVAKDVPLDCDDLNAFIENYREENKFLFKSPKKTIGSTFKSSGAKSLSPAQQMDAYIRAALGR